jgi:hypothetical protein
MAAILNHEGAAGEAAHVRQRFDQGRGDGMVVLVAH